MSTLKALGVVRPFLFFFSFACAFSSIFTSVSGLGSSCSSSLPASGPTASSYWFETVTHNGISAFNPLPSTYPVYRNVKSYGAKGDGLTDDTAAINAAITATAPGGASRCGLGCDSTTIYFAVVYFPAGTYLISNSLLQLYFTQFIGDATNPPTLLASSTFPTNTFMIETDPYGSTGTNWYTNQNDFYRQIRNFIIDMRQAPAANVITGVHWQVAQATSITNVQFLMSTAANTGHQGIWMENGSGGFISDLYFYGGKFGLWIGSQQFTSRNLTIDSAQTAIYLNWDWGWTWTGLTISNCPIGLDISAGGAASQAVGSVVVLDSTFTNVPQAVRTVGSVSSKPLTGGSILLDNIVLNNVAAAVGTPTGSVLLAGPGTGTSRIQSWAQGRMYANSTDSGSYIQKNLPFAPIKSPSLLIDPTNPNSGYVQHTRPQYQYLSLTDVINVKSAGLMGDGVTDDTAALQAVLNQYAGCKLLFFPAGVYLISSTVLVPAGSLLTGEAWSIFMASGSKGTFSDMNNPVPMLKVGNVGDQGIIQFSDFIFATLGSQPGAILIEWNIHDAPNQAGLSGMWDCHTRVGGAAGTNLQVATCPTQAFNSACIAAFALFHMTASSSAYLENFWGWVSDHDLDTPGSAQVNVYNGRGLLVESQGPVWLYGTAFEHSVMYQYSFVNAANVFMGMIQTETPYYQPSPLAPAPFVPLTAYTDPTFASCPANSPTCAFAYGLQIINSQSIFVYGAGLYSFFSNYNQNCLTTEHCQDQIVNVVPAGLDSPNVFIYNLNTKASASMIAQDGVSYVGQAVNQNTFTATVVADLSQAAFDSSRVSPTSQPSSGNPPSTPSNPSSPSTGSGNGRLIPFMSNMITIIVGSIIGLLLLILLALIIYYYVKRKRAAEHQGTMQRIEMEEPASDEYGYTANPALQYHQST